MQHFPLDPDVTSHRGHPVPDDWCFFAQPPNEIGMLLSAGSNLLKQDQHVKQPGQIKIIALWYITPFAILFPVLRFLELPIWLQVGLAIGLPILWTFVLIRFGKPYPTVTYRGELGIAVIRLRRNRLDSQILEYSKATDFFFREDTYLVSVHEHVAGHSFWSEWRDAEGASLLKLNGGYYKSDKVATGREDLYDLFVAAQKQWKMIDVARKQTQFKRVGRVTFSVQHFGSVSVEKGVLEIDRLGKIDRIPSEELASVLLDQGIVRITRTDASHVTARGNYTFAVAYVSNLQTLCQFIDDVVYNGTDG